MDNHLLLDLDDTLLGNSMEVFGPAYLSALGKYLSPFVDPKVMVPALNSGTKAMMINQNPESTLEQTFDREFYPKIGVEKSEIHHKIEQFYKEVFPSLIIHTFQIPGVIEMVEAAFARGYKISIATNPLFPLSAIEERLRWAHLDPKKYDFALVPSYESFHFAKPNPSFYFEFMKKLGSTPEHCFMVGNDYEMDIVPSQKAGLRAFHITSNPISQTNGYNWGSIDQVISWINHLSAI